MSSKNSSQNKRVFPIFKIGGVTPRVKRLTIATFFVLVNSFLLSTNFLSLAGLREGAIAVKDIRAPRSADYLDQAATERKQLEAANKIFPVYVENTRLTDQNIDAIKLIFQVAMDQDRNQIAKLRKQWIQKNIPFHLKEASLRFFVHATPATLVLLKKRAERILSEVLKQGIRQEQSEVEKARQTIVKRIEELQLRSEIVRVLEDVLTVVLIPNYEIDWEGTQQRKADAQKHVPPVKEIIQKGSIIVHKGAVITAADMEKLKSLGLTSALFNLQSWLASFLFSLLFLVLLTLFLRSFEGKVYRKPKDLSLIVLLFLVSMIGVRSMQDMGGGLLPALPVLSAVFLFCLLFSPSLTLLLATYLSLQAGWIAQGDFRFILFVLTGTITLILALKDVESRAEIFQATGFLALAGGCVLFAFTVVQMPSIWQLLVLLGWVGFVSLGAGTVAVGCVYLIERFFGVVTPLRLLELSNPNQPLLRRLMREAPGTYNHSMYVANLSESAAQEIGVNRLMTRVGAYYHDIGKTIRPYLFVENQLHSDNMHENMPPRASAKYVRAHVEEGIKLGEQYRLPSCILDFIPQHHGTMRISFFYDKLAEEEKLDDKDFCYKGPKPQSKEAAVVMLADGVEASVRSLPHPVTEEEIAAQVKSIITARIEDGQLEDSQITLTEIKKIEEAFMHILCAMYHPRVAYPETVHA